MGIREWELHRHWRTIRKRIWWVIGIFIVSVGVGLGLSFYIFTPQYEADTSLLIGNLQTNNPSVDYQAVMMNQALVKTYSDIIQSKAIEESVIQQLNLGITTQQLDKTIHIISPDQSQIIQVTVVAPSPTYTAQVANTLAQVFQQKAGSLGIQNVQVVDPATPNPIPVKPNKHLDITLSACLGLTLGIGWAFFLEALDTRFKTEEDLTAYLGISSLGSVPEYRRSARG